MNIMTVNQTIVAKPQIHIKRIYRHDINKIWTALTTQEALSSWLMETIDFSLNIGSSFQFKDKPQGSWDGIVNCKILSVDQPYTLTYSWQAKGMKHPTIVTWQLKQIADSETLITLSHTGFEGFSGWVTKQILHFGWKKLLRKKLAQHLAL